MGAFKLNFITQPANHNPPLTLSKYKKTSFSDKPMVLMTLSQMSAFHSKYKYKHPKHRIPQESRRSLKRQIHNTVVGAFT